MKIAEKVYAVLGMVHPAGVNAGFIVGAKAGMSSPPKRERDLKRFHRTIAYL